MSTAQEKIYESGPCKPCGDCADGQHHWLPNSVDSHDAAAVDAFLSERPQFNAGTTDTSQNPYVDGDLLEAHYECKHCPAVREYEPDLDAENDSEIPEHGRWYGDQFCPHPGQPCIDGCYYCGKPVEHGEHDHTQTDKAGFKGATEDRYSCVCPNC